MLSATQTSTVVGFSTYESAQSDLAQLTVPVAPMITSAPAAVVTGTTATVGGQGIAGATLKLYDGGLEVGTVTVAPDGTWSTTLMLVAVGNHILTVKQQDPVTGYWSAYAPSAQVAVNPDVPAITSVSTPSPASPTASVTVSGTGVAGYSVKVYDWGSLKATVTVAANGTWTATFALGAGSHSLTATQTATVGSSTFTSAASALSSVTVYAPPSAPPVTASPTNVSAGAAFTVSGTGVAGAAVKIYDAGIEVGSALVASNGTWTTTLALPVRRQPRRAVGQAAGSDLGLLERRLDHHGHCVRRSGPAGHLDGVDPVADPGSRHRSRSPAPVLPGKRSRSTTGRARSRP